MQYHHHSISPINNRSTHSVHPHMAPTTLSSVHPDVIRSHILPRLDGPALAATACASSELHKLSVEESLWRQVCGATWPSVAGEPSLGRLISEEFPGGHRSFFADAFAGAEPVAAGEFERWASVSPGLISAVDIFYEGKPVFSKVKETETLTEWFQTSPFLVDLLDPKDSLSTPIRRRAMDDGAWMRHLEESVRVSWVVVDPERRRAARVSSGAAVRAERHWLTGDVQLRYSTVMAGPGGESVECVVAVAVACGGDPGETAHVREVGMHVEDLEGRHVSGRESMAVLANSIGGGSRRRVSRSTERERFHGHLEMRIQMREKRERRERAVDFLCILTGFSIFVSFWSFILFR